MGGAKRIPQMPKVSTVNIRLQPWAQQVEETSNPPRSERGGNDSCSARSSDTTPPAGPQVVSKAPVKQTSQPLVPVSRAATRASKAAKVPLRDPTETEVLRAIESLYDDELKPYGRILRKRFIEHLEAAGGKTEDVDLGRFRAVCESNKCLSMEPEAGGEWSALLFNRKPAFVDVYSLEDPFPEALWSEAAAHFAQLSGEESLLPGGRYACAQALVQRGVAFISGMSLGQVCHMVQLALGHRKILGYNNGAIAPYGQSQASVKDNAAAQQSSCAPTTVGMHCASELQIASWQTARDCLRQILEGAAASGRDSVPLSNIKRLFRSRFNMELSETAFGHARLSDLLQAEHFHDICTVQLVDRGYVVVPAPQTASKETTEVHVANDNERLQQVDEPKSLPKPSYWSRPTFESGMCALSPSTLAKDGAVGRMVQNTFIHTSGSPLTPIGSSCRSSSLPKDMGSGRSAWEASCHALSFRSWAPTSELKADEEEECVPLLLSPTLTASPSTSPAPYNAEALRCHRTTQWHCSNGYGLQDQNAGAFSDLTACLVGQLLDLPWASSDRGGDGCGVPAHPALEIEAPMMQESPTRVRFCPNEPLCLDEEDAFEAAKLSKACGDLAQKRPALTPSTLRSSGFVVQNTFIKPVSVPATPIPGALRRSSSMPCIHHELDEVELEVTEAPAKCFSFPSEPWSLEAAASFNVATSPAQTASPAWSPQPRCSQLNLSGGNPCAPLVVRISDFL